MKEIRTIIDQYDCWKKEGLRMALATVVRTEASSYRRVGARMLVAEDGRWVGGISGGCLEGDALRRCLSVINKAQPAIRTYDTREGDDPVIGVGLGCQGKIDVLFAPVDQARTNNPVEILRGVTDRREASVLITVLAGETTEVAQGNLYADLSGLPFSNPDDRYRAERTERKVLANQQFQTLELVAGATQLLFEFLAPEINLLVIGDNYDVLALGKQCLTLGWELQLVGTPRKFQREHQQVSTRLIPFNQLNTLGVDNYTAVVLMSHDYAKDLAGLKYFLSLHPFYLGLLGPVKRRDKMLSELGITAPANLFGPVGLNIGAQSPEEIALSICADILRCLRNRPGTSLRSIKGSIYEVGE